ncbi:MAG TPA: WYL domain-containing protein [Acidimicrobiales bacterium]|nr:WYL domain-containing protein [Acidimicrobiales bacterium]
MPPRVEKVERVADLLLILLNAQEPLTLVQISSQVRGYPSEEEARRTQFERDKRTLRESGIPITVSSPNSSAQDGYQILAADYYLPDLRLSGPERNALRLALASVRFEGTMHAEIAVKIGAEPESTLPAVMELPRLPALGRIGEAIRDRAIVSFSYHDRDREVEPEVLVFRSGHWYLIGLSGTSVEEHARRTFRVDRIVGEIFVGPRASFERRGDAELAHELAFSLRAPSRDDTDEPGSRQVLELSVDASATASVIEMVGSDVILARDDGGRASVSFPIADEEAVISWVLGLGSAAEVVAPESIRSRVIERLQGYLAEQIPVIKIPRTVGTHERKTGAKSMPRERRASLDAGARLRRMIAMLTFLANEGSAQISDLAARFGIDEKTVISELELAACFGLPPYTPDQLLEILVTEGEVHVHRLEALERPLRLTPDEGFAVAAAARTLVNTEGVGVDSALASALVKLEAVLGESAIHVEVEIPTSLVALREAAATSTIVEIDYPLSDGLQVARRRVEPYAVVFREGKFYLDAFCHLRDDWRRFLVHNIQNVTSTKEKGVARIPPSEFFGSRAFVERSATRIATIVAPASCQYFIEPLTAAPIEPFGDDQVLVTLAVGSGRWLGNLLLRLGMRAQVVSPLELSHAKEQAALETLARYGI